MIATLRRLYTVPENIPHEVLSFLKELSLDHPHRCIKEGESLETAYRYAGHRAELDSYETFTRTLPTNGPS
mgnify:CR=1 FL=1